MTPKRCSVRLVVKRAAPVPATEGRPGFTVVPDWQDVHVQILTEDGQVLECPDVRGIALDWKDEDREPLEVRLRVLPSEVEIEAAAITTDEIARMREQIRTLVAYVDEAKMAAQEKGRVSGEPLADFIRRLP